MIDETLVMNFLLYCTVADDYEFTTFMLTFEQRDEDMQVRCANVPIIDDRLGNEPDEMFSVTFVSAQPAGVFGENNETCVTIKDDDSKWT